MVDFVAIENERIQRNIIQYIRERMVGTDVEELRGVRFLSPKTVQAVLGIDRLALWRLFRLGRLPYLYLGERKKAVRLSDLLKFVEKNMVRQNEKTSIIPRSKREIEEALMNVEKRIAQIEKRVAREPEGLESEPEGQSVYVEDEEMVSPIIEDFRM